MSAAAWAGVGTRRDEERAWACSGVRKCSELNWGDGGTTAEIHCDSPNFVITPDRFRSAITGVKFDLNKATQVTVQKHSCKPTIYQVFSTYLQKTFFKNQLVLSYPTHLVDCEGSAQVLWAPLCLQTPARPPRGPCGRPSLSLLSYVDPRELWEPLGQRVEARE